MKGSYFPGYSECVGCKKLVSNNEARQHILDCRPGSSTEKKLCVVCNQQILIKEYKEHIKICEQPNNLSMNLSSLINKTKCSNCENIRDNLTCHCQTYDNNSDDYDNDNKEYSTPRAQTPLQVFLI